MSCCSSSIGIVSLWYSALGISLSAQDIRSASVRRMGLIRVAAVRGIQTRWSRELECVYPCRRRCLGNDYGMAPTEPAHAHENIEEGW